MQQNRSKYLIGNWKMHGSNAMITEYMYELQQVNCTLDHAYICPPNIYLARFQQLNCIQYGAQDVHQNASGAHTGCHSSAMLQEFGCRICIVGHSERRKEQAESNVQIVEKAKALINNSIIPVICIGETLEQRESNQAEAIIISQLEPLLAVIALAQQKGVEILLAYEPIWAIGTGLSASPEQAQNMHATIRQYLSKKSSEYASVPLLYGGSVNAKNASELFEQPDIDGGLVGNASLRAQDFLQIYTSLIH